MANDTKKNPHVGGNVGDYLRERRKADTSFDVGVQVAFDTLQLAKQIRQLREQTSISQEQLAKLIGTKHPAIARLESGKVVPKLDLLQKIAIALGTKLEIKFATSQSR